MQLALSDRATTDIPDWAVIPQNLPTMERAASYINLRKEHIF
jgi:hypothetical protein